MDRFTRVTRQMAADDNMSNTEIPRYYKEFRDLVISGKRAVNKEISLEMNRIDNLIANPDVYYDKSKVEGYIKYVENETTLTDGSPLHMTLEFKLWSEEIYAWYIYVEKQVFDNKCGHYVYKIVKTRLTKKQFLIVARGAAKSMYLSGIQSYELNVNMKATHQITTAPTMRQANEVMSPIATSILRHLGPLFEFLTSGSLQNTTGNKMNRVKLTTTKKGVENFVNGSLLEVRPMSIDKLQGLRPYVSTVDEWLSGDIREDVIGAIEQGASKLDDYIIIAVSSEGTIRNAAGDDIKMELMSILKGEYKAPHVSIFYYKLDDVKEVNDENMWIKANPNIGITVSYEAYRLDVERAEKAPASRNDILAKRFGIAVEGYTYFFSYADTLVHRRKNFWGMPCALGADMSQGDDFCAFSFLFPLINGKFGLKTRCYITEKTLYLLPLTLRNKYEEFILEGSLVIMDGNILDMMDVYEDLDAHIIDKEYDVRCFGYDPYNAKSFVERYTLENGDYGVIKVSQGARTESVPLGEIKSLMEDRFIIFDEKLMSFNIGNAITMQDSNGNRKLLKRRRQEKIDSVAALVDAWVAYKESPDVW